MSVCHELDIWILSIIVAFPCVPLPVRLKESFHPQTDPSCIPSSCYTSRWGLLWVLIPAASWTIWRSFSYTILEGGDLTLMQNSWQIWRGFPLSALVGVGFFIMICLDSGSESLLKIMKLNDKMYRETCVDLCGNLFVEGTIWEGLFDINNCLGNNCIKYKQNIVCHCTKSKSGHLKLTPIHLQWHTSVGLFTWVIDGVTSS